MIAELWILGWNKFRRKTERRKIFRREFCEPIHALGIERPTVDANHLPEKVQRGGFFLFKKIFQRLNVHHRKGFMGARNESEKLFG